VLVTTALFAAFAGVVGAPVAGVMRSGADNFDDPASESALARQQLERAGGASPAPDLLAAVRPGGSTGAAPGAPAVARIARGIAADPGVARVVRLPTVRRPEADGGSQRAAYLAAFFRGSSSNAKGRHRRPPP
jgi:hypothetical protein